MANPGTTDTDTADAEHRVMHIRFERGDEARVENVLRAVDAGESPELYFETVFDSMDDLHRVTRPKNLELLRAIARDDPASIRETARLVERDVRQVHRNLEELAELGLIEFEQAGRSKRPTVWYDELAVELSLSNSEGKTSGENGTAA